MPKSKEPPRPPSLRDDLLSKDAGRVVSALWEVMATRDPEVLGPLVKSVPQIRWATARLDLGGALVSNRGNLEDALARIERFGRGECLCGAYPDHLLHDPEKEQARGHVRIVETITEGKSRAPDRICECTDCGQRYRVEEDDYHYTWWKWTALGRKRARRP